MSDLNTLRLAKALSRMSAEWALTLEELVAELDHDDDDDVWARMGLEVLASMSERVTIETWPDQLGEWPLDKYGCAQAQAAP